MSVLAIVFVIFSGVFGLIFLVDCIRFGKQIITYVRYGIACSLIFLAIDIAMILLIPNFFTIIPSYKLVALDLWALVRIAVFTCMGMYCCSILGIKDFPVIRCLRNHEEGNAFCRGNNLLLFAGVTVLLAVGYSVILFKLTAPLPSEVIRQLPDTQSAGLGVGYRPSLLAALVVLEFAFGEEIIFRLGIQNYLAKLFKLQGNRYWIAIVLTALFWSLGHANTLDPEWVKIVQVFPLGLALGYLFRKFGTETCILVRGAFNLLMMLLVPYLITLPFG